MESEDGGVGWIAGSGGSGDVGGWGGVREGESVGGDGVVGLRQWELEVVGVGEGRGRSEATGFC